MSEKKIIKVFDILGDEVTAAVVVRRESLTAYTRYCHYRFAVDSEGILFVVDNFDNNIRIPGAYRYEILGTETKPVLKPCPFCGNDDIDLGGISGLIICRKCGANFYNSDMGDDALVKDWNRRA
jgi:Lar family restriction alleviation protein